MVLSEDEVADKFARVLDEAADCPRKVDVVEVEGSGRLEVVAAADWLKKCGN